MRLVLALAGALATTMAPAILAADLGRQPVPKPTRIHAPAAAAPVVPRQGGDTFADAILIDSLPFEATGTTVGYADSYDEACPYQGSTSPDVVYKLAVPRLTMVDIDLWGSSYDTKAYVYREDLTVVACNDDYHDDFTSLLSSVVLEPDVKYFLVIDGYGGDQGDYQLAIDEYCPCDIACPPFAQLEGEPALHDGYLDQHNGGCDVDVPVFQQVDGTGLFCGTGGWYTSDGTPRRDTDWLSFTMLGTGVMEVTVDAEHGTKVYELLATDCAGAVPVQEMLVGPCEAGTMEVVREPWSEFWLWVGAASFTGPPGVVEYDYVIEYSVWLDLPVATEARSLSAVKGLFR